MGSITKLISRGLIDRKRARPGSGIWGLSCKKFVEGLSLFSHVANIGDVRSLVIHPASTTHSQLGEDGLRSARITPGMVRLSIGIEDISDIIADLEKGFAAAKV